MESPPLILCQWCRKTLSEHRDDGPDARMPCLGKKHGFLAAVAKPDEPHPLRALPRPADSEVVKMLEELLEQAKRGEVLGCIYAATDGAGSTRQGFAGEVWVARMIGSIEILKAHVIRNCL